MSLINVNLKAGSDVADSHDEFLSDKVTKNTKRQRGEAAPGNLFLFHTEDAKGQQTKALRPQ